MRQAQETTHERLSAAGRLALVAALTGPLLVALALVPFRTDLANTNVSLILVVVVVAVAAAGGNRLAGGLAALSAAAWFDFFLTQPYQRFTIDDADDIETAVLLIVGLVVSQLTEDRRVLNAFATQAAGDCQPIRPAPPPSRPARRLRRGIP